MQLPSCLPPLLCPFSIYGAAGCNSHTTALQVGGTTVGLPDRLRDSYGQIAKTDLYDL